MAHNNDIKPEEMSWSEYGDIPFYYKDVVLGKVRNYLQPYWSTNFTATEIVDNIFISDIASAFNKDKLKENKITHIITTILAVTPMYPEEFTYMNLQIRDIPNEDLSKHFDKCNDFIEDALSTNGRVLIHCSYGVSRSSTIVIAYLMKQFKLSYTDAYNLVKKKRSIIEPNDGFKRQLIAYDLSNRKK